MRKAPFVISLLVGVTSCGFYADLLKSVLRSGKPSVSTLVRNIPKDLLNTLENDEQQAGQFVCAVLDGDVPEAFENLATDLATNVWDEIQSGFEDVTSFIESLPTLAPAILDNIISDGEDAVSVIGELFTNPGGALTVIEGDISIVVSDVESVATGLWNDLTCALCGCCSSGTTATTVLDPMASISSSCNVISAAATTTYSPTSHVVASSTTYPSAQPTHTTSPTLAVRTSSMVQPASTAVTFSQSTTQEVDVTTTILMASLQATSAQGNTYTSSVATQGSGDGGTVVPSNGVLGFVLQAWVGLLACFIVFIAVL